MSNGNSLINLGDLAKPATVLIERVSDAIGGVFRPQQIKRVAKAEAEAKVILAEADIEISDIQQRALVRSIEEEGLRQQNIEDVVAGAIPHLDDSASPEDIEQDWLAHFFEKSRIVSDDEMQSLWSKILAGEANMPNTYSKRTIELVSTLDKSDAIHFTNLCQYAFFSGTYFPMIYDVADDIYKLGGITFGVLSHLDDIGLVTFNNLSGFKNREAPDDLRMEYFGRAVILNFGDGPNELSVGKVMLTQSGQQLAGISGASPMDGFFEYAVQKWKELDVTISESIARNP